MAFLDNSGDIILDAVLTDAGRQRMARGEFKIVKFALSDEEIDYALFNGNHPSGSAFADLSIMQTPILEAFTNNTSVMKTKLISYNRNNILYLPLLRLNSAEVNGTSVQSEAFQGYYVSADQTTDDALRPFSAGANVGFFPFNLATNGNGAKSNMIRVDQGLDTGGSPSVVEPMDPTLVENAYLVRIDHRLLRLHGTVGDERRAREYPAMTNSFVDDDAIASYYIPFSDASVKPGVQYDTQADADAAGEKFNGPLGPRVRLMVKASDAIQGSDALFDELGSTGTSANKPISTVSNSDAAKYKFIDTTMNVVGVTTGYSIDIPLRIWKKVS